MPQAPAFRVMFLCGGNICRSPTAEVITRHLLAAAGASHIEVWSTGTAADVGYPMDPGSLAQVTAHGLDGSGHVPRQVFEQDILNADMVIALDRLEFLRLRPRIAMDLWPRFRALTMSTPQRPSATCLTRGCRAGTCMPPSTTR